MPEIPLSELRVSYNPDKKPKSGKYLEALRLSKVILATAWSPIVFCDGIRRETHFQFSDWAVLDFDDGQVTLEEAKQKFCDCVHIIGTTKSHREDHHRFRVCIPWETRITDKELFKFNQKDWVHDNDGDTQCVDAARFYYPCRDIYSVSGEGYRVTVKELKASSKKQYTEPTKTGFSSATTFFMKNVIETGRRNVQIYQVSKDLFRIGLEKQTIAELIYKSPTYRNERLGPGLIAEINETINSAWRSVGEK